MGKCLHKNCVRDLDIKKGLADITLVDCCSDCGYKQIRKYKIVSELEIEGGADVK